MSKVFHIKNQPLLRTYLTWDLDFKFTCSYDDFFQGNQTNPFFIALIQQMVYLSFFYKKIQLAFWVSTCVKILLQTFIHLSVFVGVKCIPNLAVVAGKRGSGIHVSCLSVCVPVFLLVRSR